jgi:hypothetical protein
MTAYLVIASEAKQSRATSKDWIASSQVLLAMTARSYGFRISFCTRQFKSSAA